MPSFAAKFEPGRDIFGESFPAVATAAIILRFKSAAASSGATRFLIFWTWSCASKDLRRRTCDDRKHVFAGECSPAPIPMCFNYQWRLCYPWLIIVFRSTNREKISGIWFLATNDDPLETGEPLRGKSDISVEINRTDAGIRSWMTPTKLVVFRDRRELLGRGIGSNP